MDNLNHYCKCKYAIENSMSITLMADEQVMNTGEVEGGFYRVSESTLLHLWQSNRL